MGEKNGVRWLAGLGSEGWSRWWRREEVGERLEGGRGQGRLLSSGRGAGVAGVFSRVFMSRFSLH